MSKKANIFDLGKREREILESVLKLKEASVNDVIDDLADPPTYSTVRTILGQLVRKKRITFREEQGKYLYRPLVSKEAAQKSALKNLLSTIFYGKASDAIITMLDLAGDSLSAEELERIQTKINETATEEKP